MTDSVTSSGENPERRDVLLGARRELLEQRLRGQAAGLPDAAIPRRPPVEAPELSAGQQRLWFLHQLDPQTAAYNMYQAWRLAGPLDHGALERSLQDVVNRHEALRTRILAVDGRPTADIVAAPHLAVAVVDLRHGPAPARAHRARELAVEEAHRPFDLSVAPLIRATLLCLDEADHVLVIVMHHIAADEWSLTVLWRELAALYAARDGASPPLTTPPLQYADYARWQRLRMDTADVKHQLGYWRAALGGEPPRLQLPFSRPRPERQSFHGRLESRPLAPELSAALTRLGRQEGVTLFVLLLTAWQTLLHRYTGETDLVVGTPVSSRTRTELEGLIGFFLNTLVVRADLASDPPFREAVSRTRTAWLEAFANQDVPFEALVDELKPERRLSRNPIFQVMFVLQQLPSTGQLAPDIAVRSFAVDARVAKFDLTLFVQEAPDTLQLTIEYATDLFDRADIARMLGHLEMLLTGIVRDPVARLSQLTILPEAEREQLLAWGSTPPALAPSAECIHHLFQAQVQRTPNVPAVVCRGESVTYRELDRRADSFARRLRAVGVESGMCVGLCVERSPDMLAGILGILRAGAAYVPLDPGYPAARLGDMLHDTAAPVVLVQRHLADTFRGTAARVAVIEDVDVPSTTAADPAASADDVAYVIHTSGSTGRPKGVPITHRQLVHSTRARLLHYGTAPQRFLLLSPFAFDSSVAGIFWTLSCGGTLILPPQHLERDVLALAALIKREAVTHTLCVPSLYRLLLEYADPAALRSLTTVIVAGETCSASLVQQHQALLPGTELHNEYGPTEATVWSTVFRVPQDFRGAAVPIGRPIAGVHVCVLDAHGQSVPVGVPGELYIGGPGVAHGYLDRPSETAERFVPDPANAGATLYRTGDRVCWQSDGNLQFLGRMDEQVKIHGYRIEPREISAVLSEHPAVRECVVVARSGGTASVPHTGAAVTDMGARMTRAPAIDAAGSFMDEIALRLTALEPSEAERLVREIELREAAQP